MTPLDITQPDTGRFKALRVERAGSVLVITLNRPDRHNAMGEDMGEALEQVLRELPHDTSVRAVLLRGEGRSFCSGGDVQAFDTPAQEPSAAQKFAEVAESATKLIETFLAVPQPIVAAVQGYALGLGATLALMCDVVVAAETAVIADTHVPVGLVAGDGGALAWPLSLPMGVAKYYLLTGERLSGSEAARLGLVFKAVPADELQLQAGEIARKLAALPPLAVQGTKSTLNRVLRHRADLVMPHGAMLEAATFLSDDHLEATSAFMEKRQGHYQRR